MASKKVKKVMSEYKHGSLKSGSGGKVKSRKQAVAIALSEARSAGAQIISGHDYSAEFPGVIEVVDEAGGPAQLVGSVWRL